MKSDRLITRREMIVGGLGAVGGLLLTSCAKDLPDTYGNILRVADNLTYSAHRAILPDQSLVREYGYGEISSFPATGTVDPGDPNNKKPSEEYRRLREGGFADWRLSIEGAVARPGTFSLAELKSFGSRTQITKHVCEEGWSAIAQWTGVPLNLLLGVVGTLPTARFVSFYSYDDWIDSIDMLDALHPQTILAYGMNGRDLSVPHGAPVRLRVERQLGYKSMKYLQRIVVTENLDDGGDKGNPKNGWAWYVGI
ncbi:MAG: molybdopterin-dependent oxidoreductase [Acidobacteriota bacterium]